MSQDKPVLSREQIETYRAFLLGLNALRGENTVLTSNGINLLCDLALSALDHQGWISVPMRATLAMHNAAAFSDLYRPPFLRVNGDGFVILEASCPDWSKVWDVMLSAAPQIN